MPLDPIAYKPYADPDDFIREVTDLIWVNRAIGYIRENYEPDSIVHGSYGTSVGRDEVIQGTLMRISDTPDRIGQAEDVVWEARGDDAFLSSHLVLSADPQHDVVSRTIASCWRASAVLKVALFVCTVSSCAPPVTVSRTMPS
jgi:hypothetical protein